MAQETSHKDTDKPTPTAQTSWLKKNDLIRPGVYIPRESWEKFERALQVENFHRAEDDKPPVSRTDIIQAFIEKWSEKRLDSDYSL